MGSWSRVDMRRTPRKTAAGGIRRSGSGANENLQAVVQTQAQPAAADFEQTGRTGLENRNNVPTRSPARPCDQPSADRRTLRPSRPIHQGGDNPTAATCRCARSYASVWGERFHEALLRLNLSISLTGDSEESGGARRRAGSVSDGKTVADASGSFLTQRGPQSARPR